MRTSCNPAGAGSTATLATASVSTHALSEISLGVVVKPGVDVLDTPAGDCSIVVEDGAPDAKDARVVPDVSAEENKRPDDTAENIKTRK